jgi:ribosomal subunit interface protein
MIKNIDIAAVHTELTPDLKKYILKKIGRLDRFLPRQARESAHAEVLLKESKKKTKKEYTCEVVLKLPKETITVSQSTFNAFAAVDITEDTLKNRLKKYKETHSSLAMHRRVLARLRRQSS